MYRITIVKIEQEDYESRSYEKISDTGNKEDEGATYGYVSHPDTKQVETDLLSQVVVDLDLPAVIKAINKI